MINRPTNYRRENLPPLNVGDLTMERVPNVGTIRHSEEYEMRLQLRVRYLVSHPDAKEHEDAQAKKELFRLITRDFYEQAAKAMQVLYEVRRAMPANTMPEMSALNREMNELLNMLTP